MNPLFGHADVGSYGLTHSLLAWARCRLWCDDHGAAMLAPNWLHLKHKIGPWRRRERDKRQYQLLFRFPGYVGGVRRLAILAAATRADAGVVPAAAASSWRPRLVVFRNLLARNEVVHFSEIVGRHVDVRAALSAMTRPRYRPPADTSPHVAIHVRLGDFSSGASRAALRAGATNAQLPLDWYGEMLSSVRSAVGPVPARLYSDGTDAALAPLLAMPRVQRAPQQASVTDLLSIAQAGLVIASGSGFSLWGAYLGGVPRISFPGQRIVRALVTSPGSADLEPECESGSELSQDFLALLARRLAKTDA